MNIVPLHNLPLDHTDDITTVVKKQSNANTQIRTREHQSLHAYNHDSIWLVIALYFTNYHLYMTKKQAPMILIMVIINV